MSTQTTEATQGAGHLLDCVVASRVMGWRWITSDQPGGHSWFWSAKMAAECVADKRGACRTVYGKTGRIHPQSTSGVPCYSTDIKAAFDLIEHLRGQGWTLSISANDYITEPWDVRLFHGDDRRAIAHGATLPVAICRAALAAFPAPPQDSQ